MRANRLALTALSVGLIGILLSITACTSSSKVEPQKQSAAAAPPEAGQAAPQNMSGNGQDQAPIDGQDIVFFNDGRTAQGRIVDNPSVPGVHLKKTDGTWTFKSEDVKWVRRHTPDTAAADAGARRAASRPSNAARSSSSWIPRHAIDENLKPPTVIRWSEAHSPASGCLGKDLFGNLKSWKDTVLFVPKGGTVTFQHPTQARLAHTHLYGRNNARERTVRPETGKDLVLDFGAAALPDWALFVTATVEITNEANPKAKATAPGDAFACAIEPWDQLNDLMSRQKWAGGQPTATPVRGGKAWIVSAPRGPNQWILMMWDATGEGLNAELFERTFVAYGSNELLPDFSLQVYTQDRKLVGVVSVLPFPPSLSDDAKASRPIHVLAGNRNSPKQVAVVKVPARVGLTLPTKAPARKAPIIVTAHGASQNVRENLSIAHGTTAPAKGTTFVKDSDKSLTPQNAERMFHISVENRPADEFPIVAWLWIRRTAAFEGGGGLLRVAPTLSIPATPAEPITGQPIRNGDAHPHLTPLYFAGEGSPITPAAKADSAAANGLTGAFMADAVAREVGRATGTDLSPVTNLAGGETNQGMNLNQTFYITPQHVQGPTLYPMWDWRYNARDWGIYNNPDLYGLRIKTGDGNPRPIFHDRMKVRYSENKYGDVFDKNANLIQRGPRR